MRGAEAVDNPESIGQRARRKVGGAFLHFWRNYKWVGPLVLAFFVSAFDPFGMSSATQLRSHEVFMRISAPFYKSNAFDNVAVVLIEDSYLNEIGEPYPMSRLNYFAITEAILTGKPRSIFFDIHFPENRDDHEVTRELGSYLAAVSRNPIDPSEADATGPDVFLSDLGGDTDSISKYTLFDQVPTVPVKIRGLPQGHYPMCLGPDGAPAACGSSDSRASPALALYRSLCTRLDATDCEPITNSSPMLLRWSRRPEPGRADCVPEASSSGERLRMVGALILEGALNRSLSESKFRQPCFPFQTILASDLDILNETARQAAFRDQVVFVGTWFNDAADLTYSPVHGELPGLFVHATAFDNLVTLGNRYWKAETDQKWMGQPVDRLLELVALVCLLITYGRASHIQQRAIASAALLTPDAPEELKIAHARFWSGLIHSIIIVLVILALALFIPLRAGFPPTNFYGLLILAVPLLATLLVSTSSNLILVSIEKGYLAMAAKYWQISALATCVFLAIVTLLAVTRG